MLPEEQEITDEPQDGENQTVDEPQSIDGEATDPNARAEDSDAGEGDASHEEEVDTEEVDQRDLPDDRDRKIALLESQIKELSENFKKNEAPKTEAPKFVPPTEEQWTEMETQYGVPKTFLQAYVTQMTQMRQQVKADMAQMIEGSLGSFKKSFALTEMSRNPEFRDVDRYRPGIDEFLKEMNPQFHADPKILKMAYHYAKGKMSNQTVRKVMNESERNKKIVNISRPNRPSQANGTKEKTSLTAVQRDALRISGMSEEEYLKYKRKR